MSGASKGLRFIGQDGFYPNWARKSARWLFQRTFVEVGNDYPGNIGSIFLANIPCAHQVIVWSPRKRSVYNRLSWRSIHAERQEALQSLMQMNLRCYGDGCDLEIRSPRDTAKLIREDNIPPEAWGLYCTKCEGVAGPDLEPVTPAGILTRWEALGWPALESPWASPLFRSAALISDLKTWTVKHEDASHLELAYLGQQMWEDIVSMLNALG